MILLVDSIQQSRHEQAVAAAVTTVLSLIACSCCFPSRGDSGAASDTWSADGADGDCEPDRGVTFSDSISVSSGSSTIGSSFSLPLPLSIDLPDASIADGLSSNCKKLKTKNVIYDM